MLENLAVGSTTPHDSPINTGERVPGALVETVIVRISLRQHAEPRGDSARIRAIKPSCVIQHFPLSDVLVYSQSRVGRDTRNQGAPRRELARFFGVEWTDQTAVLVRQVEVTCTSTTKDGRVSHFNARGWLRAQRDPRRR